MGKRINALNLQTYSYDGILGKPIRKVNKTTFERIEQIVKSSDDPFKSLSEHERDLFTKEELEGVVENIKDTYDYIESLIAINGKHKVVLISK